MGPGDWLQEQLFKRRIVPVTGRLDQDVAAKAAAALMALDADSERQIELHLDCPDGALEAAFVLIDAVTALRATLLVRCRAQVGGPVVGVWSMDLAESDGQTVLRYSHRAFGDIDEETRQGYTSGWGEVLEALIAAVGE